MSAALTVTIADRLARLKTLLHGLDPGAFENVVAALVSERLGLGIAVAKSGFQHGGDAGPAGRQGRRFRIETKRYAEETSLSDRELLGEIDHALTRDPALEAWFLAATKKAPEQLEQDLLGKSDQLGLPIVVIDWKPAGFPALAALCTAAPTVLDDLVGTEAGDLARALVADGADALGQLTRDIETWNLGFERLRAQTHANLNEVWTDRRTSVATLGQDVAGGAVATTIVRTTLNDAFDGWWSGPAINDAPALVLGNEGVGKTWATVQWIIGKADEQPLVVMVPSGASVGLTDISVAGVKHFIGDRLYEITRSRDQNHWRLRFDRLMLRPREEGPVLTLVFDGLNQEPSVRWTELLKTLQHPDFAGRIRTVAITRNLYFTERLRHLRGLVIPPYKVHVGPYDDTPGGEFDQRLRLDGLARDDLHPDLIPLARTPRLFSLVVRLRGQLTHGGRVTVHRLLWEYGRDTLGVRDRSLSEQEWRLWLAGVARNQRDGIRSYNLNAIGVMVERPDLDQNDVFRRLSDIVDGQFAADGAAGSLTLSPVIVAHALGAALLAHLQDVGAADGFDALANALTVWLDPISGIDERAEILRAAISILLESDLGGQPDLLGLLVRDWLQSQNLPETHRGEIIQLAPALCMPLLDAVEQTWGPAQNLALDALRRMPRDDQKSRDQVIARCEAWLRTVSRDVDPPGRRNEDADKARSARLIKRIGADADGDRMVLGEHLKFVERVEHNAQRAIPTLLDGYPLVPVAPVFLAAAFTVAIRGREEFWSGLKWLCLFNEIDAEATTHALHALADVVGARAAEGGVHPELAGRIAALLLWLTGDEDMEAVAADTDPGLDRAFNYANDYEADPGRSFFALEHRHLESVLQDKTLPLWKRMEKAGKFLIDPAVTLPDSFIDEVRAAAADYDMSSIDAYIGHSVDDNSWENLAPVLARGAPDVLAMLVRRKLDGLANREAEKRRIGLSRSTSEFLLSGGMTPETLRALATPAAEAEGPEGRGGGESEFARSRALLADVASRPAKEQVVFLLDRDAPLYTDLASVLVPVTPEMVDELVERFGDGPKAADLVRALSFVDAAPGTESWAWFEEKALDVDFEAAGVASRLLWLADSARFGRNLLGKDWSWASGRDDWCNHFGSLALAEAGIALPFDQLIVRIAPWLVPHAVVLRGSEASDAELAAELLDGILSLEGRSAPDLGSDVTISQEVRADDPEAFTLTLREEDHGSPAANLRASLDRSRRSEARERAVPVALERLREARAGGASLFMHDLRPEDLAPIVRYAPSAVARWLDGADQPSLDFRRRVHLAEGFYFALCEALLAVRPADGGRLWQALRTVAHTRFIGAGGVNLLTLMLYRVPTAPEALRWTQLDLAETNTDEGLLEVALASRVSGATGWLETFIKDEEKSAETWRRQRARVLRGYHGDVDSARTNTGWPDGPAASQRETREQNADEWLRREVWARHWWDRYWSAQTDEGAYAAWTLLARSADRRAHAWLRVPDGMAERHPRRVAHYQLNQDDLARAMKKAEKKLDGEFLGRPTFNGVHPWLKRPT